MTPALVGETLLSRGPRPITVVQLLASPFLGGPERQLLGLAANLPPQFRTAFLTFAERGLAMPFVNEARRQNFETVVLKANAPRFLRCVAEIAGELTRLRADVLCCSGYKSDLLGWRAARQVGVPVIGVAHGWTGATWKVRCYEALDRWVMRRLDAVACVSEGQAVKVRRAGVLPERAPVILNAIRADAFGPADPAIRESLLGLFPLRPARLVAAAGRLSPEKGFDVLIEAAARLASEGPDVGFVLFGDGPQREMLTRQIAERGLQGRFILAGFRSDLERVLPACDLAVSSSHTEGLPVVVLEEMAAALPVVATAVGGTPEVVEDGVTGRLVPPGDAAALAAAAAELLASPERARAMGRAGRRRVETHFTFAAQTEQYERLFRRLIAPGAANGRREPADAASNHRPNDAPAGSRRPLAQESSP